VLVEAAGDVPANAETAGIPDGNMPADVMEEDALEALGLNGEYANPLHREIFY
jgi:hypothetical protein